MKLKNLAVLLIAAVMTVLLYTLGATVYAGSAGEETTTEEPVADTHSHSGWIALTNENFSDEFSFVVSV